MQKVLHEGSSFVADVGVEVGLVTMKTWEPNFVPEKSMLTHVSIWIRLLQQPIEFYDRIILEKIVVKLGTLLKIDTCTSST